MAFLFIIYYTFIELFFEFCHIFINFASKTIIKSYPLKLTYYADIIGKCQNHV